MACACLLQGRQSCHTCTTWLSKHHPTYKTVLNIRLKYIARIHVVHPMHTVRVRVLGQPLPPPKRRVYVYRRKQAEQAMQAEQVTQTEPTPDMRMWSQQTILNFLQQINVRDHVSCVNVENLYVKS